MQETWLGYYPFSVVLGHDTANCIVTQGVGHAAGGHNIASNPTTRPTLAQGRAAARAQAAWPWGELRYNSLYHGWGRPLVWRYGAARLRYSAATRRVAGVGSRYSFCIMTGGGDYTTT